MSAFANGSGGTTQSMSSALAQGMPNSVSGTVDPNAGVAGMGNALTIGNGMPDSPRYAFQLPTDVANTVAGGTGTDPTAGLTGVQSGMTMPNFSNAMSGSGNYTSNPTGSMSGAIAAGGKIASALQNQSDQGVKSGGTGRVTMRPQAFGAPVIALPMASGSPQGNSLLSMMQQYRPGAIRGQ